MGSVGQLAGTSFYPTKNLGCMGDGGAILSASAELVQRAKAMGDYGQTAKYAHDHLGMNSRLDELQAAILRDAFLPQLGNFTKRRLEIATRYRREIRNAALELPAQPAESDSVWHLFPVLVRGDPEAFRAHLKRQGIHSGRHYPRLIPEQRALRAQAHEVMSPLRLADSFARREVSLPIHSFLEEPDVERVIHACESWRE